MKEEESRFSDAEVSVSEGLILPNDILYNFQLLVLKRGLETLGLKVINLSVVQVPVAVLIAEREYSLEGLDTRGFEGLQYK